MKIKKMAKQQDQTEMNRVILTSLEPINTRYYQLLLFIK